MMNASIQQLEYIVAVDTWRHFQTAADSCFVTQPTLSMQIQKLEDEVGFKIFDRNKKPVVCTEEGKAIIEQARKTLAEYYKLREIVSEKKGILEGELHIGIIPSVAPYLLPLFLKSFLEKYPDIRLQVNEIKTGNMLKMIRRGELDAGILSTPINETGFSEELLYVEDFQAYISPQEKLFNVKQLAADDVAGASIWLLEDGHCLRDQLINFCSLATKDPIAGRFNYQAGSIETLKRMVDMQGGLTFLPRLATLTLSEQEKQRLRPFIAPAPAREISLISNKGAAKQRLIDVLKSEIIHSIPKGITDKNYVVLSHNQ